MKADNNRSFLNEDHLPLPFCPGCGHHAIIKSLDQALVQMDLDPAEVVIVTDIGCVGLSDKYFQTHAFHGLHGRSATYATGIKVARPELTVIVLVGDGGFGVGGHHFLNAARRNIGINVFVFNNLNFGMTGGEHSVTTPAGAVTSTTPSGNIERPLDIVRCVGVNGANFAARTTTFEKNLVQLMVQCLRQPGFCLTDIWELCTAYFVPKNRFSKKKLDAALEEMGFTKGILVAEQRNEYRQKLPFEKLQPTNLEQVMAPVSLPGKYANNLRKQASILIAGAAGAKIVTAGRLFSQGAILAKLHAAQRMDYPVTVKTGFSITEIILSPKEILYPGSDTPDVVVALFPEGMQKINTILASLPEESLLILPQDLPHPRTAAEIWELDFSSRKQWGRKKEYRALMALATYLRERKLYPLEALQASVKLEDRFAADNLAAIEASNNITPQKYHPPHPPIDPIL